jgi:adenylate cyclase
MTGDLPVRLALIVAVDLVGYSARTELDSTAAARDVMALREQLAALSKLHGGRIFNTAGDGAMLEFSAAREAVSAICAVLDSQANNAAVRVGAHLGDVAVAANGDLLGHGVNVAARLASAAQPGKALISGEMEAAIVGAAPRPMRAVGEVALEKMKSRITAFELAPANEEISAAASGPAGLGPRLTIAVLPFVNMSTDAEQEYLSDGIAEDIITDLSRWPSLSVTSRNSSFRFKGQAVDASKLGRDLGVRFLVEGSMRKLADRIRITAQLIETDTGNQVWAERFDRPAADLFDVQDEVVRTIVGTLAGRVHATESQRLGRRPRSSLAAYELTLRGNWLNWSDPTENTEAKQSFKEAIRIDPSYGPPYSLLAVMLRLDWLGNLDADDALLDRALEFAQRGVEVAENDSLSHMSLAFVHLYQNAFGLAEHYIRRALELNPANPRNQAEYGMMLPFLGRAKEGFDILCEARKADPYLGPAWYWHARALSLFLQRRHAESLSDCERGGIDKPRAFALGAACCAQLGQTERARELVAALGSASIDKVLARFPLRQDQDRSHLIASLAQAGLVNERP